MQKKWVIPCFLFPALMVYSVFFILPIIGSVRLAFFDFNGLEPVTFVGFDNFVALFTRSPYSEHFWNAFGNNIVFFLIVTVFQNFFGFVIAVMVTRKKWGANFFRTISFLPTTISVIVVGFLFKLMLNPQWGLVNMILERIGLISQGFPWLGKPGIALFMVAFAVSWQWMGESVIFYSAGIDGINPELFEAARIDGASLWHEIRYILLPAVVPVIAIVTILIFVGDFTQFDIVYAMTGSKGNPSYSTDIFGSLFYRVAFQVPARGGWGFGMGAAVSTTISLIISIGVFLWVLLFNRAGKKKQGGVA
ncbi:sugar ABC transporter permease [Spirochaetia bacterium 38H-sp]|uniref:Sugar ABC transporter permease n=1 Tax=Rarispira pelagica TaxID=3141764 RepID=A0ABU9UAB5_9SPIR